MTSLHHYIKIVSDIRYTNTFI